MFAIFHKIITHISCRRYYKFHMYEFDSVLNLDGQNDNRKPNRGKEKEGQKAFMRMNCNNIKQLFFS